MARKKKHEEHENHERWLVSYADFITLLFAFFVVMYAVSSVNAGKYRVLSDSLVAAFNEPKKSFEPIQVGEIVKSATNASIEIVSKPTLIKVPIVTLSNQDADKGNLPGAGFTSSPENARDIQKIADEVAEAMQKLVDMGLVAISVTDLWVEVDIKDSVLFPSGSARIRQEAVEVLTRVAAILADFSNPVRVEGFTDNVPINTPVYPSNWELSSARASSVVRLFEGHGISSSRLSAVGYGEYRPVVANDTAEGRAKNRRVVLVVLADKEVEYLLDERLRQSRCPGGGRVRRVSRSHRHSAAGDGTGAARSRGGFRPPVAGRRSGTRGSSACRGAGLHRARRAAGGAADPGRHGPRAVRREAASSAEPATAACDHTAARAGAPGATAGTGPARSTAQGGDRPASAAAARGQHRRTAAGRAIALTRTRVTAPWHEMCKITDIRTADGGRRNAGYRGHKTDAADLGQAPG
jgi:chemotaxis protein MotB